MRMREAWMRRIVRTLGVCLAALAVACGGDESEASGGGQTGSSSSGGEESSAESAAPDDGLQIQGLTGTLSQREIHGTLEPRINDFGRCFEHAAASRWREIVGGSVELAFHVHADGSVEWVYPRNSTIGDRSVELCLSERAARIRFPRPHGGEAEFNWSLSMDLEDDVREPFHWENDRVNDALTEHGPEVLSQCRPSGSSSFQVTVYVAPHGDVIGAGAASSDADGRSALDCIASAVRTWRMPDPGSYPAKVTFELR